MESRLAVVVKPKLDVSCCNMCSHVHVEIGRSMQVGNGDHTVHDSLERCEPVVKRLVKGLSAQPFEVSDEQAGARWALGQASYSDQLRPNIVVCFFEPI